MNPLAFTLTDYGAASIAIFGILLVIFLFTRLASRYTSGTKRVSSFQATNIGFRIRRPSLYARSDRKGGAHAIRLLRSHFFPSIC